MTSRAASSGWATTIFSWTVDEETGIGSAREAQIHILNVDVGVWATDRSGGTTSRLRAKQILQNALGGAMAITKMREFSYGGEGRIEFLSYTGGRFVVDKINDMQVFRIAESTLTARVFSRSPADPSMDGPAIMEIPIDPNLKIREYPGFVPLD